MRLDGYIRVSRVGGREGDRFISPDVQRDSIRRWANAHDATILAEHVDLDQSGAKANRPGLQAVLERVEAGHTQGVVVAKLDRFGRSLLDALDALRRIDHAGGKFVSVGEHFDTSTPTGKLVLRFMLSLAEFELDRIREQWNISRARAVARGVHIASRTPTGYIRRQDGTLEPHPEWGRIVGDVFKRRAGGASWGELAALLDHAGVVGPYGNEQWTTKAISDVVKNRVYLGEARSGEHVNRGAHQPLTDRKTWEAAQVARGPALPKDRDGTLLAGIVRCSGCRHLLKPDSVKLRNGERVRQYRCRGRHASGTCQDRAAIIGHKIEAHVEERFLEYADRLRMVTREQTADLERAEREAEEAESELEAFRSDARIVGALGDRYAEWLTDRVSAVDRAHRRLAEVRATVAPSLPADLHRMWPLLTTPERRRLIGSVFECVFIRSGHLPIGERVLCVPKGAVPDVVESLPRRGRRVPFAALDFPGLARALTEDLGERALQG